MYDVYLDVSRRSGRVMAHVLKPPGLGVRFEDRRDFEAGMSGAIREHATWLASHGEWRYDDLSRTVRQILRHVANAELWYITRLIDDPAVSGMPEELEALDRRMDECDDPVARLVMVREGFERFFQSAPLERLNRIVTPSWFCDIATERWTGRKALRRAIEHEREHTRSLQRTLEVHGVRAWGCI